MSHHSGDPNERQKMMTSLQTSDSDFDPIGQYYLDKSKHSRKANRAIELGPLSSPTQQSTSTSTTIITSDDDTDPKRVALEIKLRNKARQVSYDELNILEQFFFTWLIPVSSLGKRFNLVNDDLPRLPSKNTVLCAYPHLLHRWQISVQNIQSKSIQNAIQYQIQPLALRTRLKSYHEYLQAKKPQPQLIPFDGVISRDIINSHPSRLGLQVQNENYDLNKLATYNPIDETAPKLISIQNIDNNNKEHIEPHPWLFPQLFLAFRTHFIFSIFYEIFYNFFILTQPWVIKGLSRYFAEHRANPEASTLLEGMKWASYLAILNILIPLTHLGKNVAQLHQGTRQSSVLLAALFDKTFRLAGFALSTDSELSTGSLTNMVNSDIQQCIAAPIFIHFPWAGTLAIIICITLMYMDIGVAAFVAAGWMLLLLPYQYGIAHLTGYYRKEAIKITDSRIKFVTQLLSGIRVIKAYAWEQVLAQKLEEYRARELAVEKKLLFWIWFAEIVTYTFPLLTIFSTIAVYTRYSNNFTTETVFLILAYLNTIRFPIQYLSQSLSVIIEYQISTSRMSRLLGKQEIPVMQSKIEELIAQHQQSTSSSSSSSSNNRQQQPQQQRNNGYDDNQSLDSLSLNTTASTSHFGSSQQSNFNNTNIPNPFTTPFEESTISNPPQRLQQQQKQQQQQQQQQQLLRQPLISLNHVDFYWASFYQKPLQTPVLTDISFELYQGEKVIIIGPSGCGKTALLTGILGNLYPQAHKTFQGLYNIPNLSQFDINPNNTTTSTPSSSSSTTTTSDITTLPVTINEPGEYSFNNSIEIIPTSLLSVSHQCAYAAQTPFLLNDTVRNNIILSLPFDQDKFQKVIEASALSPDLAILPNADLTIVSDSGLNLSGGQAARVQFARVLYHADVIKVALLDDIFAAVDALVAKTMFFKGVCGILANCGVVLTLNSHYDFLQQATRTIFIDKTQDQFWLTLHNELTTTREQYTEYFTTQANGNKTISSDDNNGQYQQMTADSDHQSIKIAGSPIDTTKNKSSSSNNSNRTTKTNLKMTESLRMTTALSRTTTSTHSKNDDIYGFRQPSTITYIGDVTNLLQLDNPLISSITLTQQHQHDEDEDDNNNNSESIDDGLTSPNPLRLNNLHAEQENSTKLSKKIGLVTDKQTIEQVEKQLKQQVEKTSSSSSSNNKDNKTPTQARLPNRLYLQWLQGPHTFTGLILIALGMIFTSIVSQGLRTGVDVWLLDWANDTGITTPKHTQNYWMQTTLYLIFGSFILGMAQTFLFLYASIESARNLHQLIIKRIFHATLGYLDTTPVGTLINGLTRDISTIDIQLPNNILFVTQQFLSLFSVVVLSVWTSPLFIIPIIPIVGFIMYFRAGYHRTSVQVRRLENVSAQPINSLFNSIAKGAPVLRTFTNALKLSYIDKYRKSVDEFIRSKMVLLAVERRFGFYLNCLSAVYISLLTFTVILFRHRINTTLGMLAITYSSRLTGSLQVCIRFVTMATQAMTSTQRIDILLKSIPQEPCFDSDNIACDYVAKNQPIEFKKHQEKQRIEHYELISQPNHQRYIMMEDDETKVDLHFRYNQQQKLHYWPWYGKIEFKNVSLRYRPELPIVLHKVNFTILAGQHVGVVGRTGSGKSTTLLSLLRLIQPEQGSTIEIDGIDITQIGLGDLRSRSSLIPQTPTLFSGTIRSNLDPLSRYTDNELWYALKLVAMLEKVQQLENGLYSKVDENGSNLASSERQLLSIARSLLAQPNFVESAKRDDVDSIINNQHYTDETTTTTTTQFKQQSQPITTPPTNTSTDPNVINGGIQTVQLQQGSILLADEITSSVSADSDALVQHTIRNAFEHATILVIAHRLASVVDLDRILVLRPMTAELIEQGISSVQEFEVPFILLNNPETTFFQMCLSTGIDNFILLWLKARDAFYATKRKELLKYGNIIHVPTINYELLPIELVKILRNENGTNNNESIPFDLHTGRSTDSFDSV